MQETSASSKQRPFSDEQPYGPVTSVSVVEYEPLAEFDGTDSDVLNVSVETPVPVLSPESKTLLVVVGI